jgi:hypothetical protein
MSFDADNYKPEHHVTVDHSWLTLDSGYANGAESIRIAMFFDTVHGVEKVILELQALKADMLAKEVKAS